MNAKTLQLIEKLKTTNTTLARVWSDSMMDGFSGEAAYKALNGRQQGQIDLLRKVDQAFASGGNPGQELYILSDGAFKTF